MDDFTQNRTRQLLTKTLEDMPEVKQRVATTILQAFLQCCQESGEPVMVSNVLVSTGIGALMGIDPEVGAKIVRNSLRIHEDAAKLKSMGAKAEELARVYTQHPAIEDNQLLCKMLSDLVNGLPEGEKAE